MLILPVGYIMINMEQENKQSETPVIKKSKGPVICSALCIILALSGIGFGVYGMFFQEKASTPVEEKGGSAVQKEAPSREKVAELLKNKYAIKDINREGWCGGTLVSVLKGEDSEEFNESTKLALILNENYSTAIIAVTEEEYDACEGSCSLRTISYADLNQKYHYYFGSDKDLEKKTYSDLGEYGLPVISGNAVVYNQETDKFEVKFMDGLGCAHVPDWYYNKISSVTATENGFIATSVVTHIDATKAIAEGFTGDSECGGPRSYKCPIIEEGSVSADSSVYDLSFVEEDGEYKLVNVTKK